MLPLNLSTKYLIWRNSEEEVCSAPFTAIRRDPSRDRKQRHICINSKVKYSPEWKCIGFPQTNTCRNFNTSWERVFSIPFLLSLLPTDVSLLATSSINKYLDKNYVCLPEAADLWTASACCTSISYNFPGNGCACQVESEYMEQDNSKHLLDRLSLSSLFIEKFISPHYFLKYT